MHNYGAASDEKNPRVAAGVLSLPLPILLAARFARRSFRVAGTPALTVALAIAVAVMVMVMVIVMVIWH